MGTYQLRISVRPYVIKDENDALMKQVAQLKSDEAEAYHNCHVLQREIDALRMVLNDARGVEE